jgi:hypothetical protein
MPRGEGQCGIADGGIEGKRRGEEEEERGAPVEA